MESSSANAPSWHDHTVTKPGRDCPSPLLTAEQVREILIECNGRAGAAGGSIGAGAAGTGGGRAGGGRAGGRLGAGLFTRVTGQGRTLPTPYSDDARDAIRAELKQVLATDADDDSEHSLIGLIGTGWMNLNTAVVQLRWHAGRAEVTAHALEGLVNQRSASKALDLVERALSPYRSAR